ncbi:MAG: DUF6600 domain-containing protein [Polyangiales bacterium]
MRASPLCLPWLAAPLVVGCATVPVSSVALLPEQPPARAATPPRVRSLGMTWGPTTARAIAQATEGHGAWVSSPTYGAVWLPAQPAGFVPYVTDGRWLPTDAGWFWQSTLPWGDLAFHYGRWVSWNARWAWVPGTQFAPAWVDWRLGDGWVAWAPQAPRGAPTGASFVYCRADQALQPQLAQGVVQGAAASSLYPRTQPVPASAGYLGAVYAFGPPQPEGVAPTPLQAITPGDGPTRPTARADLAALADEVADDGAVEPPRDVAEVPVAQGVAPHGGEVAEVDARAPVRIRAEDLARPGSARVSVISMPYGARAELWRERPRAPVAPAAAPPATEEAAPPPLPPPADVPLAWWPMGGRRGLAVRRGGGVPLAMGAEPMGPLGPPTAPLIGMRAPPPVPMGTGIAVNPGGGFGRPVGGTPVVPTQTAPRAMAVVAMPVATTVPMTPQAVSLGR